MPRPLPPPPPGEMKKVLAVQVAGIGDLVLAVPALRALKRAYPRAHLSLLTSHKARVAAEGCPYVDELFTLDHHLFNPPSSLLRPRAAMSTFRLIRRLRRERFGLAINLIGIYSLKGALALGLLLWLSGARLRAGRDTDGLGLFFHLSLPDSRGLGRHERDANLALVALLGSDGPHERALEVWTVEEDERHVEALLASGEVAPGKPIIGINPSTDCPAKNWPLERFIALADELSEEFGAKILLTGGPAEKEVTALMASRLRRPPLDTTCRLSFRQTPSLLKRLSLFISCDTAAMHLAYAVGVPTVALFGPGDPRKYGPWAPHNIIIAKAPPCAPCMKASCGEIICTPSITLEKVLEASRTLLRRYPKGSLKGEA